MAGFCLMPQARDKFLSKIKDGTIEPGKLSDMTSQERHELFSSIVGEESAKGVNSLFESKLLLKNQERGLVSWAKKVSGITPEVRRDLESKIARLDHVLDPAEKTQFLNDLANTRLGVDVTQNEAAKIADMSRKIAKTKELQASDGTFKSEESRMAYGRARVDMADYVTGLRHDANKSSLADLKNNPLRVGVKAAEATPGLLKSLKATLDDSALFRQGWKTLMTNPVKWQTNARKTFGDIWKELGGKDAMREVKADIVSRPNYDKYRKMGLDVGNFEEAFPSQLPEKVPGLKRLFKASESAYTGFLYRQRADIADKYLQMAEKNGVNIADEKQLRSIGNMVNSLTGRGNLGSLEKAGRAVNTVFFSPKALKGNLDTLTAHQLQKNVTPFVRKQAAINLMKIVGGTAVVLGTANAMKPGSVEWDPRSSNFGKIKIGNTRFDVSGGMAGIVTLAARIAKQSSKTAGGVTHLGNKPGQTSGLDLVNDFFENKLSPVASVVKDLLKQEDFNGNKPTVKGELGNALIPLPVTTYAELKGDPNSANDLIGLIADGLGISTNTYGKSAANWENSDTKEIQQFKQKLGTGKLKEANQKYNQDYDDWYNGKREVANLPPLGDVPQDQKAALITRAKSDIQDYVFHEYNFKYEKSQEEKDATKAKAKETRERNKARGF